MTDPRALAFDFYARLRAEVVGGNPALDASERQALRAHYPVMMDAARNPPELAATIYAERRQHPVAAILQTAEPVVFDAGCGYGSESFLFASIGARVLAVDADAEKIRIARSRQGYFEKEFQRALDITFFSADLDEYVPVSTNLSLTWLASVLAAIRQQDNFLACVRDATRDGGRVIVTDMNLWNPLFLFGEWKRRRGATATNHEFARAHDLGAMFARRGRVGARYLSYNGSTFDDVQFLHPASLRRLYESTGWHLQRFHFSGFVPPALARYGGTRLETALARVPLLAALGYFYLGIGVK